MTRAVIGSTELATKKHGKVELRPASSIVLFDEEGALQWKAP